MEFLFRILKKNFRNSPFKGNSFIVNKEFINNLGKINLSDLSL